MDDKKITIDFDDNLLMGVPSWDPLDIYNVQGIKLFGDDFVYCKDHKILFSASYGTCPLCKSFESIEKDTERSGLNRVEFLEYIQEIYEEAVELLKKKNADYALEEDPFANFRRVEALNITSVPKGMLVRLSDKLARITVLLSKEPDVVDERMRDTVLDAINYLAIFLAYWETEVKNG